MNVEELIARRDRARDAAHTILEIHESSHSRVVALKKSFTGLSGLPVDVAEYYREALKALSVGCYRGAIVMSWAGFMFMVASHLIGNYPVALALQYPTWNTRTTHELLELVPEAQVLDAGKVIGAYKSQKLNIYKGWLSTRNQAAHPTLYSPSRNVALGFVDAVIAEVTQYV